MNIGRAIRHARRRCGWTQGDLAIAIRQAVPGSRCDSSLVSQWETGRHRPSPAMLLVLRDCSISPTTLRLPISRASELRQRASTRQVGALLDADAIAPYLRDLAETGWTGTATELLSALDDCATESDRKRRDWPGNAKSFGRRLAILAPALRQSGIQIIRERDQRISRQRRITLCITDE